MPRTGSQYNLPYNWNNDKTNGIKVLASRMQAQDQDIANALTGSLASNGDTPLTGNLDFNNNKGVDLAKGTSAGDTVNVSQAQTGELQFYGITTTTPAGTDGEDYDLGPTPTITVYPTYTRFSFICHYTCIINPNMRFGTLAPKTLKKSNGASGYIALAAGDMVADKEYIGVYNEDINNTDIIIENPESVAVSSNDLINNLAVSTSVAANALTIAIKTAAGTDPTTNDSVSISFRSATATSGSYNTRSVTSATSLVISSGSTLGTVSGVAANLYVYALDNAGTVELAVSSYLFHDNSLQSTTAEGGSGGADSATVLYSTTARTDVPVRLIGIINITEPTAGTWSLNATTITSDPIGYIATTSLPNSKAASGYSYFPNGIICQWGTFNSAAVSGTENFPISYPNAGWVVVGCHNNASSGVGQFAITSVGTSSFNWANTSTSVTNYWVSYGN